jgi:hypothetical protein
MIFFTFTGKGCQLWRRDLRAQKLALSRQGMRCQLRPTKAIVIDPPKHVVRVCLCDRNSASASLYITYSAWPS